MEKVIDEGSVENTSLTDDEQESIVSEAGLMPVSQDTTYDMQAEVRPAEVVARAQEQAEAIMHVVEQKKLYHVIRGKKYLMVEAWQLLAAFNGLSLVIEETERIKHDDVTGWQARCVIYNVEGKQVGAGKAECLDNEKNWKDRDDYMLLSMAQTRAISKACRTILSFVVTLAGYEPTPYDEMIGVFPDDDKPQVLNQDSKITTSQIKTIKDLATKERIVVYLKGKGYKSLKEVSYHEAQGIVAQIENGK